MEDLGNVAGSNLELTIPVTAAGLCAVLVKCTYVLDVLLCVIVVLGSTTLLVGCTSYSCVLLSVSYKKKKNNTTKAGTYSSWIKIEVE